MYLVFWAEFWFPQKSAQGTLYSDIISLNLAFRHNMLGVVNHREFRFCAVYAKSQQIIKQFQWTKLNSLADTVRPTHRTNQHVNEV